ncbi:MAG: FAD/NAD(P)-binding protein [Alphaproteobacteria bacterium]
MANPCDIAIVGGGFSGLAVLANIVQKAKRPLSVTIISRDPPDVFGPAYSTPRPEHLLNVRAAAMGLFDDNHRGFYEWAAARDKNIKPDEYLSRNLFARYLASVREETLLAAEKKSIIVDFVRAELTDIVPASSALRLVTDGKSIEAKNVILAIGNTLKAKEEPQTPRLISDVWNFNYEALERVEDIHHVAIIGSGLTALDTIISLLNRKWKGKITCLSGSALLPQPHPIAYDAAKVKPAERQKYLGRRLSGVMQALRKDIQARINEWPYVIDGVRPLVQEIWKGLSPKDRQRMSQRYFNLWNVHRHRCDANIRKQIDDAAATGAFAMLKAKCTGFTPVQGGVDVAMERDGKSLTERYDIVFKCFGINYAVANNPLLMTLLNKGLLKSADNPYGIAADANFRACYGPSGTIYALGTPLFGQLFETTAVPELRHQAAKIADEIISGRSGLSQSPAADGGESPGAPPEASAIAGN